MPPRRVLLIDGYNVLHRVPRLSRALEQNLEQSREALLRHCSAWRARHRSTDAVYVVFDGDSSVYGERTVSAPGVKAIYTRTGETADDRIISIFSSAARDMHYTVVSDDNEIRRRARVEHADHLTVEAFMASSAPHPPSAPAPAEDKSDTLSAFDASSINRELREAWGLDDN